MTNKQDQADSHISANRSSVGLVMLMLTAEVCYLIGRSIIVGINIASPAVQELVWTGWRLVFVSFYFWLARDEIRNAPSRPLGHSLSILTAIGLLVVVAPLSWPGHETDARLLVFGIITTPIVAIREELAYRVLLAGGLAKIGSPVTAMIVSTVAFVGYHVGWQPLGVLTLTAIAGVGLTLCVIYLRTRNLFLIVVLHAFADWVALIPREWEPIRLFVLMGNLAMAGLALLWWRRIEQQAAARMR